MKNQKEIKKRLALGDFFIEDIIKNGKYFMKENKLKLVQE
jgi:hypothetical protein